MAKLSKYEIIRCEPKGKLVYPDKTYQLETLTDKQAEELEARGSIYIKKIVEKPLPPEPPKSREFNKGKTHDAASEN